MDHKSINLDRNLAVIISLVIVFFVLNLVLVWNGGDYGVFNSPDANANYHFAERIYHNQQLGFEISDTSAPYIDHLFTRSTRIVESSIMPSSFLGLVYIYGTLSKLLFVNLIPYLTILIASIAVIFFYKTIRELFDPGLAQLSAILLMVHPAWWYYTNDSLLPNVLFCSLTIIALYYLFRLFRTKSLPDHLLFVLFIGLAVFVRSSEIIWLLPLILIILFANRKRFTKRNSLYGAGFLILIFGAIFLTYITSGSTGIPYLLESSAGQSGSPMRQLATSLLPFGFSPSRIFSNYSQYVLLIFWPFTLFSGLGILYSLIRKQKKFLILFGITVIVGAILVFYYGSWVIQDHPDPSAITIGTSYVRYFLPLYILLIPFVAYIILRLIEGRSETKKALFKGGVVVVLSIFLYLTAFVGNNEGILEKRQTLKQYDRFAAHVVKEVPASSIILTSKGDKFIWPKRLVITNLNSPQLIPAVNYFINDEDRNLYYLADRSQTDEISRITEMLSEQELALSQGKEIESMIIYEINSNSNAQ